MERERRRSRTEAGLEELNLVEFPLALLTDRQLADGVKTLEFSDSVRDGETGQGVTRQVIVTGSDKWGLPNWQDMDVLLALMKLSNDRHGFSQARVDFSLYELRELLAWPRSGPYKRRLKDAILRLLGVTVAYENAWRKNGKWKSTSAFHLLEIAELSNTQEFRDEDEAQHLVWNQRVVESVQANHTKGIDWLFYLSLRLPTTKRLYRFLDKRFYLDPTWSFDLGVFCYEKLGMNRRSPLKLCKQQLGKAILELESTGFLAAEGDRFERRSRGVFRVNFSAGRDVKTASLPRGAGRSAGPLFDALKARGVTNASELCRDFEETKIKEQLENFDDRNEHGEKLSPAWLRKAIETDGGFSFRKGYLPKAEREARAKERAEKRKREEAMRVAEEEARSRAEAEEQRAFECYFESLSLAQQKEFTERAVEAGGFLRNLVKKNEQDFPERAAEYREMAMKTLWRNETGGVKGASSGDVSGRVYRVNSASDRR